MVHERSIRRYQNWYAKLLRLYPRPYYERFGEQMEQTFNDLCRERRARGDNLSSLLVWVFVETSTGIIRENIAEGMQGTIRRLAVWAVAVALILLVPLVAMQFTAEVNWDLFDFAVAGILLFGTGLAYELVARRGSTIAYRVAVGIACAAAFLLVWVNGAVGIIGNEGNPANLMYFGVLAIGAIGAFVARLELRGLARTLFTMAIAQALVPVIALVAQVPSWGAAGVGGVFMLNAFFVVLFAISALLFRRASASDSA